MLEHLKNVMSAIVGVTFVTLFSCDTHNSGHSFLVKLNIIFSLFSFDTRDSGHYIFW
jgi:hypothetical protein